VFTLRVPADAEHGFQSLVSAQRPGFSFNQSGREEDIYVTAVTKPEASVRTDGYDTMDKPSLLSVLFPGPIDEGDVDRRTELPFFRDLNLDQVLRALTSGREEYNLVPFFCCPLDDVGSILYRQEVMKDLERQQTRGHAESFAGEMREMRSCLAQAGKLRNEYQKMSWFLDAVEIYCDAVKSLQEGLSGAVPGSKGMRGLVRFLEAYVGSDGFGSLRAETKGLKERLSEITYRIHIQGLRVSVGKYGGEPDYSADVRETFRKFYEGEADKIRIRGSAHHDTPDMNGVEERIMDLVARLYPDFFRELSAYNTRYGNYLDPTVRRFDREVQFYLAYLRLIEGLEQAGLSFCYPEVDAGSKSVLAADTFDLALAMMLAHDGKKVVCNDFCLQGRERIFVVSGPNQGGKTTFARTFGQLHYLARLGLQVPGKEARLFLSDNTFTHFEREEHIESLRGKLQDELVRMHDVLQHATGDSIVIVNEGFASTTVSDALFIGREILQRIIDKGCLGVYVTFIDELSRLGEAAVSMVSTVVPENPTQRTFKVVRKPADGRAYAMAIAEKYGLTRESVRRRLAR